MTLLKEQLGVGCMADRTGVGDSGRLDWDYDNVDFILTKMGTC